MRIIKYEHACVRIESAAEAIVVDPGGWTRPEAVADATAVFITHEHADHLDVGNLRATSAPIFTIEAVADQLRETAPDVASRVEVVTPGQQFIAGVPVEVVGQDHAEVLPQLHFYNSGFIFEVEGTQIFHPGDALTVPERPVDLLLVPVSAPWLKVSECVAFVNAVGAPHNLAIHDMIYSDKGLGIVHTFITNFAAAPGRTYDRVEPGSHYQLPDNS